MKQRFWNISVPAGLAPPFKFYNISKLPLFCSDPQKHIVSQSFPPHSILITEKCCPQSVLTWFFITNLMLNICFQFLIRQNNETVSSQIFNHNQTCLNHVFNFHRHRTEKMIAINYQTYLLDMYSVKYVPVITRCQVKYVKHFPSFSYFPISYTRLYANEITAK